MYLHCYVPSHIVFQVTVLESNNKIGGRVLGDESLGWCVGRGAQIVSGSYNNPIIILCKQVGCDISTVLLLERVTDN